MTDDKLGFYKHMQRNGIDITWTYRYSCAESYQISDCPNARKAAQTVLGLPTYPSVTDSDAQYICEKAKAYFINQKNKSV
jgi:dTDP-4-amino-4,6-dideoxygalactose transaminase